MYRIKPLEQEQKFDCCELKLKKFLDDFASKEAQMGWQQVFTIPVNRVLQHVPTEWGSLTVQDMSDEMAGVHQTQTRAHQDSCI